KCAPAASQESNLIELNPMGRWTVRIATRSTTIIGTVARGTKAPRRISSPPTISTRIVAQPQQIRERCADRVQDRDERIRSAGKFRVAMLDEAEADDQPQRQSVPARRKRQWSDSEPANSEDEFHAS